MTTKIILRELTLSCSIGIDRAEKHLRQQLVLDADIILANLPDDDATVSYDYHTAVVRLRQLAAKQHYGLMETFAEAAAGTLLAENAAATVRVYCRKPKPFDDLSAAGVEIVRHRCPESQQKDEQ
ncbi:MAG: dihydroneopterin aldolase [Proteobacteria bacterium]|nr:dihydroneopterin aldolase [Pseudomonadota bacterium]